MAELLEQLEELQTSQDASQLREFVGKLASLIEHDGENRELLQLQQRAASLISALDAAAAAAAAAAAQAEVGACSGPIAVR